MLASHIYLNARAAAICTWNRSLQESGGRAWLSGAAWRLHREFLLEAKRKKMVLSTLCWLLGYSKVLTWCLKRIESLLIFIRLHMRRLSKGLRLFADGWSDLNWLFLLFALFNTGVFAWKFNNTYFSKNFRCESTLVLLLIKIHPARQIQLWKLVVLKFSIVNCRVTYNVIPHQIIPSFTLL